MLYKNNKINHKDLIDLLIEEPTNEELLLLKSVYDKATKDLIKSNVFEKNNRKYYKKEN
jgi:hypothetical protein